MLRSRIHGFSSLLCLVLSLLVAVAGYAQTAPDVATKINSVAASDNADAQLLFKLLAKTKLNNMTNVVDSIVAEVGPEARPVLLALVNGVLFYKRDDLSLLVIEKTDTGKLLASDALTGVAIGEVKKNSVKKIRVNNNLRVHIRSHLARLDLSSDSLVQRRSAVLNMLENMDASYVNTLMQAQASERDSDVKDLIDTALAIFTLRSSTDQDARLTAIATLSGRLESSVKNVLTEVAKNDTESDPRVKAAALKELNIIQGKVTAYGYVEQLFFGLSLGSVLLLAAIGLAITFGVMGVINMAHGEMIMIGAYATFVVQQLMPNYIEYSLWVAIPTAFLAAGLVGVLIERCVIRYLHGRPLETLLATFGISLILQQVVRTVFSPLNRAVETPDWMSGSLELNAVLSITYSRIYIFIFALMVFFLLQLILKKTSLGLNVRAVSQNRDMAKSMGIRTDRVDAMTFGLGSGIAGVAGVALSQITNVGPNLGQAYIIDSFMVVVFGGVGNLLGTLFAGFTLGIANKILEPATGAVLANIIVLVFIILFMQKRPKGLFPQKGRAAE
jgi:urea transport system permease protein